VLRSGFWILAGGIALDEFSEGTFGVSLGTIFAVFAALLDFGKNSVDGPTASRAFIDFELAGQMVEIFGALIHGPQPYSSRLDTLRVTHP
jgi:hypothetical protein